ncbi:MAG: heliorhodopsin HeR [Actinomycetes bacterium]|jgi:hypothetical protein
MGTEEIGKAATFGRLRRLNVGVGLAHALQAVAILAIAKAAPLPIVIGFMTGPPGSGQYEGPVTLFDLRVDWLVVLFLALAAIDHLSVATWARGWYERQVERGINPARWIEYSISASVMVVLIGLLTGIDQITAVIALFGVNAAMILFGLVMEQVNLGRSPEDVDWRPFIFGCIAGAVPWIAIAAQLVISSGEGGTAPVFVYVIFATLFVLFNTFAVNMWLQYRGRGRWADPIFAERVYLWLSLAAKSALAWQVYFGALAGS